MLKAASKRILLGLCLAGAVVLAMLVNKPGYLHAKEKDPKMAQHYSTTTHCIGRFLIDLPSSAEFVGSTDQYAFTKIEIKEATVEEFQEEVAALEARLRGTKHDTHGTLLINKVDRSAESTILAFYEESAVKSVADLAGYHWVNGFRYRFHALVDPDEVQDGSKFMSGVMAKLQPAHQKLQMEKGFCIRGALIADNDDSEDEDTTVSFRLKDKPDVMISVSTSRNGGAPPETLLSRKRGVNNALGLLGASLGLVHNMKEGDRTINGIPGQEWLLRAPNDHEFQSHLFTWEAQGRAADTLHPQIRIELQTASYGRGIAPGAPSLSDDEAITLWDRILDSLRVRPVRSTTSAAVERNEVPLGTSVRAGEVCPQSGWWRCADGNEETDVIGGRAQYLRAGVTIPQAVLLPPATVLQKLLRQRPAYREDTPSTWQLVDRRKKTRSAAITALATQGAAGVLCADEQTKYRTDILENPLGIKVDDELSSGETCAASGWWECLEPNALDGVRWFARGAALPAATTPVLLSGLQRLSGSPKTLQTGARWRLVRLADSAAPMAGDDVQNNTAEQDPT